MSKSCEKWSFMSRCQAKKFPTLYSDIFFYIHDLLFVYLFVLARRSRDRMIVGFTTACVISAYHH
jgi:hypothetical protein